MITTDEQRILEKLLDLAPAPQITFTYLELTGFLFGLAITPEKIPSREWMPVIFEGDEPEFTSMAQAEEMTNTLTSVLARMRDNNLNDTLHFPFAYESADFDQIEEVYEWVSGLEEALSLREELWDPEEFPAMAETKKLELFEAMMSIRALVDPEEFQDLFSRIPDDALEEFFPEPQMEDKEAQLVALLISSLPHSIETLQQHSSRIVSGIRRSTRKAHTAEISSSQAEERIIHVDFRKKQRLPAESLPPYCLHIFLEGLENKIWRRIQVPATTTLGNLHRIIQICMGWQNSHMHQFLIERTAYCPPDDDTIMRTSRPKDEARFALHQLNEKIAQGFLYIYDFGDDWLHRIELETEVANAMLTDCSLLLAGEGCCPPEDCGGVPGYIAMLEILSDPEHKQFVETLEWIGHDFDPGQFGQEEIDEINTKLKKLRL